MEVAKRCVLIRSGKCLAGGIEADGLAITALLLLGEPDATWGPVLAGLDG